MRMLGSGRPFVLEIINARAAVPPQAAFDAMQLTLEKVISNAASLVVDVQPCTRFVTSLHDAECYMTGLITEHRYSEAVSLLHCCYLAGCCSRSCHSSTTRTKPRSTLGFNAVCSDLAYMCGVGGSWGADAGTAVSASLNL